jgi:hypothetical protein
VRAVVLPKLLRRFTRAFGQLSGKFLAAKFQLTARWHGLLDFLAPLGKWRAPSIRLWVCPGSASWDQVAKSSYAAIPLWNSVSGWKLRECGFAEKKSI